MKFDILEMSGTNDDVRDAGLLPALPPDEHEHLKRCLRFFNVEALGQGNMEAGINTLVAMAGSITNLCVPDSGVGNKDDAIGIGVSLIASGSLTTGLICDKVLSRIAMQQESLVAMQEEHIARAKFGQKTFVPSITRSTDKCNSQASGSKDRSAENSPELPSLEFITTGETPAELRKNLRRAVGNLAFAHYGVSDTHDLLAVGKIQQHLSEGRLDSGRNGQYIRGQLFVLDPIGCLAESVGKDPVTWVDRTIWLVDGSYDPLEAASSDQPSVRITRKVFEQALEDTLKLKLNRLKRCEEYLPVEIGDEQRIWMEFLASVEPRLPGISGTARKLFSTLLFGLSKLVAATKTKNIAPSGHGIMALAKLIVLRMEAAKADVMRSMVNEREQWLMERVLSRLEQGREETRDLYRALKITAAACREILGQLEQMNAIRNIDGKWELSTGRRTA